MEAPEITNKKQSKKISLPRWANPIGLALAFLLLHVAAPYGLSLLSNRYGWAGDRPGPWNLLALILVGAGIAGTIWIILLHFRASPETFTELQPGQKLITPGPYAFSRNPSYLFELAFWFGWTLFYGSITVFIGFLLWFAMFSFVLIPYEERDLEKRFGEAYRQYKNEVPRWLGRIRR